MSIEKFRTFLTKIIETNGMETLRCSDDVADLSRYIESPDKEDLVMINDMAAEDIYSAFLDEQEGVYDRSVQILKEKHHHEETEIRAYLDALKDVLDHSDPHAETENERKLKKAEDYANGNGVCQDYERAGKLIGETSIWKSPRGTFISLMSAIKGEPNDLSVILDGEPVKSRISPERYGKYKDYVFWMEEESETVETLVECAQDGVPEAQYLLGRCYGLKDGDSFVTDYLKPDEKKAEEWIAEAEKNGFQEEASTDWKEDMAINGEKPDMNLLRKLAEDGYAEAQITYAETFPAESKERRLWMKKAVRQGNVTAMRKLAVLYQEVEHDYECYMIWLEQAVKEEDPEAQYLLGCEYLRSENEDGTDNPEYDWQKGRELISKAAFQQNFDAIERLYEIEKYEAVYELGGKTEIYE